MIIRSFLRCTGTQSTPKRLPKASFYARFYSVMQAMQVSEDVDSHDYEEQTAGTCHKSVIQLPTRLEVLEPNISPPPRLRKSKTSSTATRLMADALVTAMDIPMRPPRRSSLLHDTKSWRRRETTLISQDGIIAERSWRNGTQAEALKSKSKSRDSESPERSGILSRNTASEVHVIPTIPKTSACTLNSAIQNLFKTPSNDHLENLVKLLSERPDNPSVKTFNIIISRLTRLRYNAAAWAIFKMMLQLKYTPDQYTISSILNLCIVTNSYLDFCKVIKAARLQRRLTNISLGHGDRQGRSLVLFSTLIKGCIKFKKISRAETYLTLMRSERVKPNMEILTLMVQGYTDKRDWEAGRPHFQKMLGLPWDRKTVVVLIAYCRACKRPYFEAKVRKLATIKNVFPLGDGDDLARLPANWKTKGLPVPDRCKRPL